MSVTEQSTRPAAGRRERILAGALGVFAAAGYADARMDEIARAAGVAKPTLYNHFADKADLFAAVLRFYAERSTGIVLAAINGLDVAGTDLRAELERVGNALVACLGGPDGHAVIRLQVAEEPRFPELIGTVRDGSRDRALGALTGKLAELVVAGRLRLPEPRRGARHFMALVTDDLLMQSGHGTRQVAARTLERSVAEGVDTFLAAFGPPAGTDRPG